MKFAAKKNSIAGWLEWEPNPILVKEMRQAVRSRVLSGALMVFLLLLFLGSVVSLVQQGMTPNEVLEMGRKMFDICLSVLAISGLIFIPAYTGIRVALEKHKTDLILYTPLAVTKLVNGKLLSGMCIAGLFFCVCVPFMAFCNLLRGLDWMTIQFVIFFLFFAIYVAIIAAIAVAVQPFRDPAKLAFGAFFGGGLVVVCYLLLRFLFAVVRTGIAPMFQSAGFWSGLVAMIVLGVVTAMGSYSLSLTHIVKNTLGNDSYGEIKFQPPND